MKYLYVERMQEYSFNTLQNASRLLNFLVKSLIHALISHLD